ncbi:30S ribosomal protein S15 [Candidatus Woesearchaeota archaeon]|nr:30S ribosomal protein S15 [Candidatus Woesearchaeota archaeon]
MARRYSGKRGKAGSKKPLKKTIPSWMRYSSNEVEMLIKKMAKDGKTASEIGMMLRDKYGIPDVNAICRKSITSILEEAKLLPELPEDLMAMIRKAVTVRKHLEANKHDMTARRGIELAESKVKRLVKYYKKTGKLASGWKYDPEKAGFFMK